MATRRQDNGQTIREMSSYATAYLSDGRPVCSFRNGVDQLFFILFTKDDWIELSGEQAYQLTRHKYSEAQSPSEAVVIGFRTTAGALRDRLDVLGVDVGSVSSELERLIAEEIERSLRIAEQFPEIQAVVASQQLEDDAMRALDWGTWVAQLRAGLNAGQAVTQFGAREGVGSASWLMSIWDDHDPRFRLRALLEAVNDSEEITLDIDDLIEGGWLDPSVDPQSLASEFVAYASQGGLPPIVLTEGAFDAEVLASAVRVRRPHLVSFIRFPDFTGRPEGGAAALRQTVRAFASAGIPNRVLAIFDNDTAARDVVRTIDLRALPSNVAVVHLPTLPSAVSYPTLGPQGEKHMDVNGLAASIELFLGSDVLAKDGAPRPIEWRGYVPGMRAYQGEVAEKAAVDDAFRVKVALALANPDAVAEQDWAGTRSRARPHPGIAPNCCADLTRCTGFRHAGIPKALD